MQEIKDMETYAPKPTVEHVIESVQELSSCLENSPSVNLAFEMVLIILERAKSLNKSEMDFYFEKGRLSMISELNNELESKNK